MEVLLQRPVRCSNECLKRSGFLAPHFERAKPCRLTPAPGHHHFLKALAIANTAGQSALEADFLTKCWESCMKDPGYRASVRLVLFLQLVALYFRHRFPSARRNKWHNQVTAANSAASSGVFGLSMTTSKKPNNASNHHGDKLFNLLIINLGSSDLI